MSVAIYPYMPHSKRPNISETGLQSVSSTVDRTFTMQNLCNLVRCKECQRTERSRSTRVVPVVPSLLECPDDLEGHEAQRSQKAPGVRFVTLRVALVVHLGLFVL